MNRMMSPTTCVLSLDHYRIGKSMQRTLDRERVGRWGGRGDWNARQSAINANALAVWNAEMAERDRQDMVLTEVAAVSPTTPLVVESDAIVDAEREARLAKRRERDRARRAAAKAKAVE